NFFYTNLDWYKRLTPEKQKALDGLITDPGAARREIRKVSDGLIEALKQKPGTTVITLPPETLARWRVAAGSAAKEIVAQSGPRAQEVLDAVNKGLAAYQTEKRAKP
ncbi:MAG: hypothetical protein JNK21_08560, partial [Rhodospirillaceae bacterium]|nr:hypothetical protein [Rhodospirillaceae bacterium]